MADNTEIIEDLKEAISECDLWHKNYLEQKDSRDTHARAVAKTIAAIEQAVPEGHTYRRQADVQLERIQKSAKPSDRVYGLGELKGIAAATLDMASKAAYGTNQKAKMKMQNSIVAELLQLITDLDAAEQEWWQRGDHSSCNDKIDFWKERATKVILKLFGSAKAAGFKRKTVWRSPSGRQFDDFKRASAPYRQYILDLIDEAKHVDIPIPQRAGKQTIMTSKTDSATAKVFIIHGHDERNRLILEKKLKKLVLEPLIMMDAAPKGMQTFVEKFEQLASQASHAIALFTNDDLVMLDEETINDQVVQYFQARPNVLFELGWFVARLGREKVLIVCQEDTNIPTDLQGIERLQFKTKVEETYEKLQDFLVGSNLIKVTAG